jgi:plastocyanin
MKRWVVSLALASVALSASAGQRAPSAGGSIEGRVRLTAPPPGNPIIRMGMDPRCAEAVRGQRIVQDAVVTSADGGLANAFVYLAGSFPDAPPPAGTVTIDQQRCMFRPRVVGARVGQTIEFRNSDPTLHDVHGLSKGANEFNIGQPIKGMVYRYELKREEVMLHIACDVHRWMTAFVGVVDHPYFAVSGNSGTFTIDAIPAGHHTIRAWHERYGTLTQSVDVTPGNTSVVEFIYTGSEKPDPQS